MTLPRSIKPNQTYLVTRRCVGGRFLLRPDPEVTQALKYIIGEAARHTGIVLHSCVAMPNHMHTGVTDRDGRLPDFMQRVGVNSARCLNAYWERQGYFWDSKKPHYQEQHDAAMLLKTLEYAYLNPIRAGIVASGEAYPGLWIGPERFDTDEVVERPDWHFSKAAPATTVLRFVTPKCFAADREGFKRGIVRSFKARESEIRRQGQSAGRTFGRANDLLRLDPEASPQSPPPPRRGTYLDSTIACSDREKKKRLKAERLEFYAAHVVALLLARQKILEWQGLVPDSETPWQFPAGTWHARVFWNFPSELAPDQSLPPLTPRDIAELFVATPPS